MVCAVVCALVCFVMYVLGFSGVRCGVPCEVLVQKTGAQSSAGGPMRALYLGPLQRSLVGQRLCRGPIGGLKDPIGGLEEDPRDLYRGPKMGAFL